MRPRLDKEDGADLAFALASLSADALSRDEFAAWIVRVIETNPADWIPYHMYDLLDHMEAVPPALNVLDAIGFVPADPALDGADGALDAIAHLRGRGHRRERGARQADVDGLPQPSDALKELARHPEFLPRFRTAFPFARPLP